MRFISLAFMISSLAVACQFPQKKPTTDPNMPPYDHGGRLIKIDSPGISDKYRFTIRINNADHQFSSSLYLSPEEVSWLKDSAVNLTFKYRTSYNSVKKVTDSIIDGMSMIYEMDSIEFTPPQ